jgi:hypothetical protein
MSQSPNVKHIDILNLEKSRNKPTESNYTLLLENFLQAINNTSDDSEKTYKNALDQLRGHVKEIIVEIIREEAICEQTNYSKRWGLVFAACELKDNYSLPFLKNTVLKPIPDEQSKDPHSLSTIGEETIIRTTAVDGIRSLAELGNKDALRSLFEFLSIPSLSIRRASVQGILSAHKDDNTKKKVLELLPKDQHFIVSLKPMKVQDFQQIDDPEKYLKPRRKTKRDIKAPELSNKGENGTNNTNPKIGSEGDRD